MDSGGSIAPDEIPGLRFASHDDEQDDRGIDVLAVRSL
jgi:hypothetical protein